MGPRRRDDVLLAVGKGNLTRRQKRRKPVSAIDERQMWKLSLLRSFVRKRGFAALDKHTIVAPGVRLGAWVAACRTRRRSLPSWLAEALAKIPGWSFTPADDERRRRLAILRDYVARSGWDRLVVRPHTKPGGTRYRGLDLGDWIYNLRSSRRDRVTPWLVKELERIPGWTWEKALETTRRRRLELLREYVDKHGWRLSGQGTVYRGVDIGRWVGNLRHNGRAVVERRLRAELEAIPGFTWTPARDLCERRLERLRSYLTRPIPRSGRRRPLSLADLLRLGTWIEERRHDHVVGRLDRRLFAELDAIPGWTWKR